MCALFCPACLVEWRWRLLCVVLFYFYFQFFFGMCFAVSNENNENTLMVLNIGAYLHKSLKERTLCECVFFFIFGFKLSKLVDLYFVDTLNGHQVALWVFFLSVQIKSRQLDSLSHIFLTSCINVLFLVSSKKKLLFLSLTSIYMYIFYLN